MKAVVLQISGSQVAVLADDGCMHNIPNRNYHVGEQIPMTVTVRRSTIIGWAAAVAAVLCVGATGAWATFTPYYYVSLDVNPSVEYTLNRFDRVLSVKGVNDDGSELLLELDSLGNKKIDKAISDTVAFIDSKGYFDGELAGGVVISTSAKDIKKAERLATHLRDEVESKANSTDRPVHVEAMAVGRDRVDEAHELGITPGKLNLIDKLKEATGDADMSYNEWLNKPVKDIMKAIKDNRIDVDDLLDDDGIDDDTDDDLIDDDDIIDDDDKVHGKPESKPSNPNKPISKPDYIDDDDADDDKVHGKPDDDDLYDDDDDKVNGRPESKSDNANKPDKDKSNKGNPHNDKSDDDSDDD